MICYVSAMGKQHLGPHVVVGYFIKVFWPGLFITSPDHLDISTPYSSLHQGKLQLHCMGLSIESLHCLVH